MQCTHTSKLHIAESLLHLAGTLPSYVCMIYILVVIAVLQRMGLP